jgi:cytochrome P450
MHISPEVWDNPLRFEPLRFMSEYNPKHFTPFAAYAHHCIGENLAMLEASLVLGSAVLYKERPQVPDQIAMSYATTRRPVNLPVIF